MKETAMQKRENARKVPFKAATPVKVEPLRPVRQMSFEEALDYVFVEHEELLRKLA